MMKRRKADAFEELLRSTSRQWEEVPEGFDLVVIDDSDVEETRVVIPLPRDLARLLSGDNLQARVAEGRLVLKRRHPARKARPARLRGKGA